MTPSPEWRCPECGTVIDLLNRHTEQQLAEQQRQMAELRNENANLRKDREQVKSYLQALNACARNHPGGYTIVDFQQVWLEQERDRNAALKAELAALREQSAAEHEVWDPMVQRVVVGLRFSETECIWIAYSPDGYASADTPWGAVLAAVKAAKESEEKS